MSVEEEDIEDTLRRTLSKYDSGRVRALGYSGRFVLLRDELKLWAYIGSRSDYLVIEGLYCSCGSFTRSLLKQPSCIHLAAVEVAKSSGRYRRIEASDDEVVSIVWELLTTGFSKRLREKLYKTVGSRGS